MKMKVRVRPPLGTVDRLALDNYIADLIGARPGYLGREFKFRYRGSEVMVSPEGWDNGNSSECGTASDMDTK